MVESTKKVVEEFVVEAPPIQFSFFQQLFLCLSSMVLCGSVILQTLLHRDVCWEDLCNLTVCDWMGFDP